MQNNVFIYSFKSNNDYSVIFFVENYYYQYKYQVVNYLRDFYIYLFLNKRQSNRCSLDLLMISGQVFTPHCQLFKIV